MTPFVTPFVTPIEVSCRDARRLLLDGLALLRPANRRLDTAGLLGLIERIGFVQVDSIRTVARAHDMILFARSHPYRPADLRRLLERERTVFEDWTHDAAIVPTRWRHHWRHRHAAMRGVLAERWRQRLGPDAEARIAAVRARIARDGPLRARDFEAERAARAGGWWDWHPDKAALEYLWRTGELAICRRDGFEKVFDLAERHLPVTDGVHSDNRRALIEWACASALGRLGIASPGEIAGFWNAISIDEAKAWCAAESGRRIRPVIVAGGAGARPARGFAAIDIEARIAGLAPPPASLRILSPFDPLLRDRRRCLRLFGFDYRIEIFVPAERRRFGYYVFPILEGDRLIGRIDMTHPSNTTGAARHGRGALRVTGLWLEPGVRLGAGRRARLDAALERVRRLCGADGIVIDARAWPD